MLLARAERVGEGDPARTLASVAASAAASAAASTNAAASHAALGAAAEETALPAASLLLASALAGVTARLATHPLDTAKTWRQMQGSAAGSTSTAMSSATAASSWRALYRGLGVACALHAPAMTVYLATYDRVKHALVHGGGLAPATPVFAASALCAEAVSGLIWTPLEVLKQRLQVAAHRSATEAVRAVLREDGWRGLYRGYPLALGVFMPYSVVFFVLYEHLTAGWRTEGIAGVEAVPPAVAVTSGAAAGALAGALVNPLDVVKTRWQVARTCATGPQSPRALAAAMLASEGWTVFTRGMLARALWTSPSVAIGMGSFELYKSWLVTSPPP